MKLLYKQKVVLFIYFLFCLPSCLFAQNEKQLNSLYSKFLKSANNKVDSVRFTGSDFSKAGGGFVMQRGLGSKWTWGTRQTILQARKSQIEDVRKLFDKIALKQFVVKTFQEECTYFSDSKTAYAYSYDSITSTLYFMKVQVEGEISIPRSWMTQNYVDATAKKAVVDWGCASKDDFRQLGLARLWSGIKQNYVFLDRLKINLDSLYMATIPLLNQAKDDYESVKILQRFAAAVGDGHTYVSGLQRENSFVKLSTKYIDGHVYVDEVEEAYLEKQGVRRGMELVEINGKPTLEYGREYIMPYVSSSTPQWTLHSTFNNHNLLVCNYNDTMQLVFQDKKGKQLEVTYSPALSAKSSIAKRALEFRMLNKEIGYLKINAFWNLQGDFNKMFESIFPKLSKAKSLIIDIRNNTGGNSGYSDFVLTHLSNDSIPKSSWSSPNYIPAYASWGIKLNPYKTEGGKLPPHKDVKPYNGPIALLVDEGTFSSAEDFCIIFKSMKRGVIIGTKTGGSTGNGVRINLIPDVCYANICSKHDVGADGTDFVGKGIEPTLEVKETYQSYFEDTHDAATTAAIAHLKEATKKK